MNKIQWFPGHMAKANREMEEAVKLVDIVIELRDARCPLASHNPNFDKLVNNKPRLVILNKADLADDKQNSLWLKNDNTILLDSTHDNLNKIVINKVKEILKEKIEKSKAKGIRKKVLRAMVIGIPNVGKSTFINNVVKKKVAKAENRPGVTKALSWININDDLQLLDTPGVLWPKFDNQDQAKVLAILGSINDDVVDKEELANYALEYIKNNYPGLLNRRYGIDEGDDDLLVSIAKAKNILTKNNVIDYTKVYEMILQDIRNNKLGRITYEKYDA